MHVWFGQLWVLRRATTVKAEPPIVVVCWNQISKRARVRLNHLYFMHIYVYICAVNAYIYICVINAYICVYICAVHAHIYTNVAFLRHVCISTFIETQNVTE